jgi:hypothetical protein
MTGIKPAKILREAFNFNLIVEKNNWTLLAHVSKSLKLDGTKTLKLSFNDSEFIDYSQIKKKKFLLSCRRNLNSLLFRR